MGLTVFLNLLWRSLKWPMRCCITQVPKEGFLLLFFRSFIQHAQHFVREGRSRVEVGRQLGFSIQNFVVFHPMTIRAHAVDQWIVIVELGFVAVVVARARKESKTLVESTRARGQRLRQSEMPGVKISIDICRGGLRVGSGTISPTLYSGSQHRREFRSMLPHAS